MYRPEHNGGPSANVCVREGWHMVVLFVTFFSLATSYFCFAFAFAFVVALQGSR